jgi:hypothetical protein
MPLRDMLERVLTEYRNAETEPFARHPLAYFIRHDCPDEITS